MSSKTLKIIIGMCATLAMVNSTYANEFTWQLQGGIAWPKFNGSTQNVNMGFNTINQYTISTPSQGDFIGGTGIGYQFDYAHVSANLGLSAYYMQSEVSGINSPLINGGNFDTLTYSATGHSTALMFEPKLIWTTYAWQPYVLIGAGVAFNNFNSYSETPTDPNGSATPTLTPFNGKSTTSFAYEVGLGIQHPLSTKKDSPLIGLDCRFMDWGNSGLSTYSGQPNNDKLSFGRLQTVSFNLSVAWPF